MKFLVSLIVAAAAHASARPQLDACKILTKSEIAAVQGEKFTDAKLTTRGESTTCFYQLPTFVKSVSIDLMRSGARKFWDETFEKEHEAEAGEHEEKTEPLKVRGVGSEALWVGSRAAGSLYVRKGDAMVRVSVGGSGDDKEKIAKSKKLAIKALSKL